MRCKVGDMAVIIDSDFPENIGAIVEVLCLHSPEEWETKPAWPIKGVDLVDGSHRTEADMTIVRDADLRPIRPPETPVTETRDEVLTV